MMTWLTRLSFFDTADDLNNSHLALQVRHGYHLVRHVRYGQQPEDPGFNKLEPTNPVLRMWAGYERALSVYALCMSATLTHRGFVMTDHISIDLSSMEFDDFELPIWWGDTDVLRSHRSNLARRWPKFYGSKWRGTPESMPYIFPFADGSQERGYRLVVSSAERRLLDKGLRKLPDDIRERVNNL